jgi:hypothetical protein
VKGKGRSNAEGIEQSGRDHIGLCLCFLLKSDTPPGQFGPWKFRGEQMDSNPQADLLLDRDIDDDAVAVFRGPGKEKETEEYGTDRIWAGPVHYGISPCLQQDEIRLLPVEWSHPA